MLTLTAIKMNIFKILGFTLEIVKTGLKTLNVQEDHSWLLEQTLMDLDGTMILLLLKMSMLMVLVVLI